MSDQPIAYQGDRAFAHLKEDYQPPKVYWSFVILQSIDSVSTLACVCEFLFLLNQPLIKQFIQRPVDRRPAVMCFDTDLFDGQPVFPVED